MILSPGGTTYHFFSLFLHLNINTNKNIDILNLMTNKPIIQVKNLSKKYKIGKKTGDLRQTIRNILSFSYKEPKEIWALKDISFEVNQGEVFGIIGPNGSGKSTLLKILSKITYPTTGKAILNGRVSSLLEVGTGFHPELTGRENIYLNGSILGMKRVEIKEKFDEIVDFSGVEKFIDTPVKHYSSGMYVRLAFSVAAHLEPEILLVDEVLSVGDMAFRQKSMGKMNEVAQSGRTVVFVSHNLNAVENLCDRGLYINSGEIKEIGNINNVINRYLNIINTNIIQQKTIQNNEYIEYIDLSIMNSNQNIVQSGKQVVFKIKYEFKKTIVDAIFRLEIKNNSHQTMFVCNNILTGNLFINLKGSGKIFCSIPKLNLNNGNYYIDLYIEDKNKIIFQYNNFLQFQVAPGNFYKTNRMPGNDRLFLIDHNWSFMLHEK